MITKKVITIIVTYNGMKNDWIENCLNSLCASEYPIEILVVDNNSQDSTVDYIKSNFTQVHLIESMKNLGFGGANNIGIEWSIKNDFDLFFLLNQDARVTKESIGTLVKSMEENKGFGIISPIHLDGSGSLMDKKFFSYATKFNNSSLEMWSDIFLKEEKALYEIEFVNAAAWMISKHCIKKVGGFAPIFYHYGEDDNYIKRIIYKNLKLGIQTKAIIYHDRESRKPSNDKKLKSSLRGHLIKSTDPNYPYSFVNELKILLISLAKLELIFNREEMKINLLKIKQLFKKKKEILVTRKVSLKSYAFLNLPNDLK